MLSARAATAREFAVLAAVIQHETKEGDGLVVFPEGEVLNFLSGRHNPVRHKLYLPGYLNESNEAEVLGELVRASPAVVVVWRRALGEYGAGSFGEDYGGEIRRWIDDGYERTPFRADAPGRQSVFEYYVRRAPRR